VRVDFFVPTGRETEVAAATEALRVLLVGDDGDPGRQGYGGDGGTGIAGRPVLGLLFWVRAGDVGIAASTAVDTAGRACAAVYGESVDLYDVTVIPRSAVSLPEDANYPPLPD
jgi:hypothetical protein